MVDVMKKKAMDKFIDKYCKFVICEPGEERAKVISGILREIDYKDGFIVLESKDGEGLINIRSIVAIKPKKIEVKNV
jgi:hypothetical protein